MLKSCPELCWNLTEFLNFGKSQPQQSEGYENQILQRISRTVTGGALPCLAPGPGTPNTSKEMGVCHCTPALSKAPPSSPSTFSNLILIMALSLLWFQLLQPLRRLFFWPKIYKKTLFILSLWKLLTETTTKRNVHLVALFFPCTKKSMSLFLTLGFSHLSSFSTLEGSTLLLGVPSCALGDLKSWAEPMSPVLSDSCLFLRWA